MAFGTYIFSLAVFWTAKPIALVILYFSLWSKNIITSDFCKQSRVL
jgi:hypothetical protein